MARKPNPKPVVPRKAWALVRPNGRIAVDTVATMRKWAIWNECRGIWGETTQEVWASHRAQGWRVVKVIITEVAK